VVGSERGSAHRAQVVASLRHVTAPPDVRVGPLQKIDSYQDLFTL
jgi:hypothetical protein